MNHSSLAERLQKAIGLPPLQTELLIQRAAFTYKTYRIEKRSGGFRWIAQPAREIKVVQHWLIENVFSTLPIHACASAYKPGSSIRKNAEVHSKNNYLVKLDFSNFFNSIRHEDLVRLFKSHLSEIFGESDLEKIARLCCYKPDNSGLCLSVGAPTSPVLSNAVMYEFDLKVAEWCATHQIVYTRYADDLTFSTNVKGLSSEVVSVVEQLLAENTSAALAINREKTIHLSKKVQRRVTGLVLDNEGQVSLGRQRKREISSLIHKFSLNSLPDEESYRLQGLIAFASDVEPMFVIRMKNKYGNEVLSKLFALRKPTKVELFLKAFSELEAIGK